jgi:acyl carrier protein
MINRGGEKLAPIEIENALLRHSAVAQAAVFAVPHPSLGEEAAAAIVLRDGHAPSVADLQAHLLETLSFPKIPRRIVFRDALPKGPTGKLRRIGLAHLLGMDAPARAVFVARRTRSEHELARLWRAALGRDAVGIDDDFFDLGGNSLAALRIAADIARMMDVELPLVQFLRSPTIATQALAVIERQLSALDDGILDVLLAEAESAPA